MSRFRSLKLFFAAGLAALLLLAQLGAVAHAVKHDAHKPDAPCALCVFADHLGNTPVAVPYVFSALTSENHALPLSLAAPYWQTFRAYAVRAPPLRSEI